MSGDAENFGMADDLYENSKLEVRHGLPPNKAVRYGPSLQQQPIIIKAVMENFQSVKMAFSFCLLHFIKVTNVMLTAGALVL